LGILYRGIYYIKESICGVAKISPTYAGNPNLVKIGERIRAIRKAQGLSQEQLANDASLDRSYMGGIERGEHNFNVMTLIKIAKTLNIEIAELFNDC
jgi:DNA-binding XRE family transcriptional regulator